MGSVAYILAAQVSPHCYTRESHQRFRLERTRFGMTGLLFVSAADLPTSTPARPILLYSRLFFCGCSNVKSNNI